MVDGRLTVKFTGGGCLIRLAPYDAFFDYDGPADTLVDYQRLTWVRDASGESG